MKTSKSSRSFSPVSVYFLISSLFFSFPVQGFAEGKNTKSLRFVEGTIHVSEGKSHSSFNTDIVGGIFAGMAMAVINPMMDAFISSSGASGTIPNVSGAVLQIMPTAPTGGQTSTTPVALTVGTATPGTGTAVQPTATEGSEIAVFVISNATGGGGVQPRIADEVRESERSKNMFGSGSSGDAMQIISEGTDIGIGIGLDTFWVPLGSENNRFESELELTWSFTPAELNGYNGELQAKALRGGLVPIGALKAETKKSRYIREVGARADLGVDVKWKKKWRNNVVGVNLTDLGVEIRDEDMEKLGAADVTHADTMNVSDIPGLAISLAEKIAEKATTQAGQKSAQSLAEKIFDQFELGVIVTQKTYARKAEIQLEATATGMDGKQIPVSLAQDRFTFDAEDVEQMLQLRIPEDCPPIKKLTLRVKDATYKYNEAGNVEIGITAKNFSMVKMNTGVLTDGIGKYFQNEHSVEARDEDKPSFNVEGDPLVYVPFHGIVQTGSPAVGVAGATVNLWSENKGERPIFKTTLTQADGRFQDSFYLAAADGKGPVFKITAGWGNRKAGVLSEFKNNEEGYVIKLIFPQEDYVSVSGTVRDTQGSPLEGVEVHATGESDVWIATDAQGKYRFDRVLRAPSLTVSAQKGGYNFQPMVLTPAAGDKALTQDLQATSQMPRGVIRLTVQANGGGIPAGLGIQRMNGQSFNVGLVNGAVGIPVTEAQEKLTLSAEGFSLSPSEVSVSFPQDRPGQEVSKEVTATPIWAQSIELMPSAGTIETGGASFQDGRAEEKIALEATVKDSSGNPKAGVPVRFEIMARTGTAGVKFSNEAGGRPGCGYGMTDASGKATVEVRAYNTLGTVSIRAVATDKFNVTGKIEDELKSATQTLVTIVPTNRVTQPVKPVAGVVVYTNDKAVANRLTPTIEVGGEMVFHLAATSGQVGSPLQAAGQWTGYKIAYSKNKGSWQEETFATPPPATLPRRFPDEGSYRVSFSVKERCGGEELWSDPAIANFEVLRFVDPTAFLTLPKSTGTVNLPFDFTAAAAAPSGFKNITIDFGDNSTLWLFDTMLLAGKTDWTATYHHAYAAEGTYTFRVHVVDLNNRTADVSKTVTIAPAAALNDTTAPTGSITINNGATTTSSRDVGIHVTGSDNQGGSGVFRYRFSNNGSTWGAWQSANFPDDTPVATLDSQKAWNLSDGSGLKTVYCQIKDAAENVSVNITATITYSNQVSLSGASGSGDAPGIYPGSDQPMYTWDHDAPTGFVSVTGVSGQDASLALVMNDGGTAPGKRMCFSANGTTWTGWEPFAASKDLGLISGQTKVYVKYADGVGNVSQAYSADIPAQGNPPVAPAQPQMPVAGGGLPSAGMAGPPVGNGMPPNPMALEGMPGGQGDETIPLPPPAANDVQPPLSDNETNPPPPAGNDVQPPTPDQDITPPLPPPAGDKPSEEGDIALRSAKVPPAMKLAKSLVITAQVFNENKKEIKGCVVEFFVNETLKDQQVLDLKAKSLKGAKFTFQPEAEGEYALKFLLKGPEGFKDTDEKNNGIEDRITVIAGKIPKPGFKETLKEKLGLKDEEKEKILTSGDINEDAKIKETQNAREEANGMEANNSQGAGPGADTTPPSPPAGNDVQPPPPDQDITPPLPPPAGDKPSEEGDIALRSAKMPPAMKLSKSLVITAQVFNENKKEIKGCIVEFFVNNTLKDQQVLDLKARSLKGAKFTFQPEAEGEYALKFLLKGPEGFKDADEKNNVVEDRITVISGKTLKPGSKPAFMDKLGFKDKKKEKILSSKEMGDDDQLNERKKEVQDVREEVQAVAGESSQNAGPGPGIVTGSLGENLPGGGVRHAAKARPSAQTTTTEEIKPETVAKEVLAESSKKEEGGEKAAIGGKASKKLQKQTKRAEKKEKPDIRILKVTPEAGGSGMLIAHQPLMVLVEVESSLDMEGPLEVALELKEKKNKQVFQEGIERLVKGSNSFKWDLVSDSQPGKYTLGVAITHAASKLKEKSTQSFTLKGA